MEERIMDKNWYKSKAVWAAVATAIVGILQALGVAIPHEAYAVLAGLGLYGVRDAQK